MEDTEDKGKECDTVVVKRAELCTILGLLNVCSAYGMGVATTEEEESYREAVIMAAHSIAALTQDAYGIDEKNAIRLAAAACSILKQVSDAGGAETGESKKPEA